MDDLKFNIYAMAQPSTVDDLMLIGAELQQAYDSLVEEVNKLRDVLEQKFR